MKFAASKIMSYLDVLDSFKFAMLNFFTFFTYHQECHALPQLMTELMKANEKEKLELNTRLQAEEEKEKGKDKKYPFSKEQLKIKEAL